MWILAQRIHTIKGFRHHQMLRKVPHGEKGGLKTGTRDCKYLISALNAVHISLVKVSMGTGEVRSATFVHTYSPKSILLHGRSDNFYLTPFKVYILSLH